METNKPLLYNVAYICKCSGKLNDLRRVTGPELGALYKKMKKGEFTLFSIEPLQ